MLYHFYEWNHAVLAPWRAIANATQAMVQNPLNPVSRTDLGRTVAAMAELFERTTRVYGKPSFGLDETVVDGATVPVADRVVWEKPFCRLLHFERAVPEGRRADPRILVVAPMSGHYATLLRGTVEALLPHAEVYITDWTDARLVPVAQGRFDLDDYVDHVVEILRFIGPDTHVIGVCQPAVPVLMATAVMEAAGDPCSPATMTLMGGPIDTRENPTAVNRLAQDRGIDWFRDNVIMKVPFPQPGFMRDVYPGFLQLTGFMSMNLDRHLISHKDFFFDLVKGDGDTAERHRTFYDEYNAVMDLTAEFYLQTVDEVFVRHSLPKGEITHRGVRIDASKIVRTALMTIEGENDDISGLGQTKAAHTLCSSIPEDRRVHYVQAGVGHYGVFNGSRYRSQIVPRIVEFVRTHGRSAGRPADTGPAMGRSVEELTDAAPASVSSDSLASAVLLVPPSADAPQARSGEDTAPEARHAPETEADAAAPVAETPDAAEPARQPAFQPSRELPTPSLPPIAKTSVSRAKARGKAKANGAPKAAMPLDPALFEAAKGTRKGDAPFVLSEPRPAGALTVPTVLHAIGEAGSQASDAPPRKSGRTAFATKEAGRAAGKDRSAKRPRPH